MTFWRRVCVPGELEAGLDRLGAAVADERAGRAAERRDPRELGGGLRRRSAGRSRWRRNVEQVRGLVLDRLDDVRVAVARGVDGDAGGEVEEDVAVDVLERAAQAAHGDDRVRPRQAGARPCVVELDVGPRLGARELGHDVRDGRASSGVVTGPPWLWIRAPASRRPPFGGHTENA